MRRRDGKRVFLPPYRPELNPIGGVWKLTRRRCLHSRHFCELREVVAAADGCFGG